MDATGLNFTCATCHMGPDHDVVGSRYAPTAKSKGGKLMRGKEEGKNPASCQSCHGDRPHAKRMTGSTTTPARSPARPAISRPTPAAAWPPR